MDSIINYFHQKFYPDMNIEDVANAINSNEEVANKAMAYVHETHYPDLSAEEFSFSVMGQSGGINDNPKQKITKKGFNDLVQNSLSRLAGYEYWNEAQEYIKNKDWGKLQALIDSNKSGEYTPVSNSYKLKKQDFEKKHTDSEGYFQTYDTLPEAKFFKEFDVVENGIKKHFKVPIYGKPVMDISDIESRYEPSDGTWSDMWSSIKEKKRKLYEWRDENLGRPDPNNFLNTANNYLTSIFTPANNVSVNNNTGDGGVYTNSQNQLNNTEAPRPNQRPNIVPKNKSQKNTIQQVNIKPTYEDYLKTVNPDFLGPDYDLETAYKKLPYEVMQAWAKDPENNHLPDTYKLPNHPTFSNESIYYRPGMKAGRWEGDNYIPIEATETVTKKEEPAKKYTSPKQFYQGRAFMESTGFRPGYFHPEEVEEAKKNRTNTWEFK